MAPRENTYFLVRHGESKAMIRGIIVSTMERGTLDEFSLTARGIEQAAAAGEELARLMRAGGADPSGAEVLSSPFSRTRRTAEEIARVLGGEGGPVPVTVDPALRERDFGTLDLQSTSRYQEAWTADEATVDARAGGTGETVAEVAARGEAVVTRAEARAREGGGPRNVVLVAHGDLISILRAALVGSSLKTHRADCKIGPAEIEVVAPSA